MQAGMNLVCGHPRSGAMGSQNSGTSPRALLVPQTCLANPTRPSARLRVSGLEHAGQDPRQSLVEQSLDHIVRMTVDYIARLQ